MTAIAKTNEALTNRTCDHVLVSPRVIHPLAGFIVNSPIVKPFQTGFHGARIGILPGAVLGWRSCTELHVCCRYSRIRASCHRRWRRSPLPCRRRRRSRRWRRPRPHPGPRRPEGGAWPVPKAPWERSAAHVRIETGLLNRPAITFVPPSLSARGSGPPSDKSSDPLEPKRWHSYRRAEPPPRRPHGRFCETSASRNERLHLGYLTSSLMSFMACRQRSLMFFSFFFRHWAAVLRRVGSRRNVFPGRHRTRWPRRSARRRLASS